MRTVERLTDQDLRVIAEAPREMPATELARQLGRPYFTVAKAVQRIRRDGWICPIAWTTCTECSRPLTSHPRRTAHPSCEGRRWARYSRQAMAEGRKPKSTPYVAAWRERDPEAARALREKEKARLRERYPDLPIEVREGLLDKLHAADRRYYEETAPLASRSGDYWTADEDEYVLATLKIPARDVALELGRSHWAVRNRRTLLRKRLDEEHT